MTPPVITIFRLE